MMGVVCPPFLLQVARKPKIDVVLSAVALSQLYNYLYVPIEWEFDVLQCRSSINLALLESK